LSPRPGTDPPKEHVVTAIGSRAPDQVTRTLIARLRAAGCVFAEEEAALLRQTAASPAELEEMARRRIEGLPLEHVLGWARFHGVRVAVEPGVFVPRRRTELLVDEAARLGGRPAAARPGGTGAPLTVVDLCCGCGALGVALVTALAAPAGAVELHAADVEPAAVRCARRNVEPLGGRVHQGDLYDALPTTLRGRVDILLANVPYVPTAAVALLPREARDHEPRIALDGGADGLAVLRRVADGARSWLATSGHLLVETGHEQSDAAAEAFAAAGLVPRTVTTPDATALVGTAS
jgi:release factor glutamine methyltransferase